MVLVILTYIFYGILLLLLIKAIYDRVKNKEDKYYSQNIDK
jgi:hypothetical protein